MDASAQRTTRPRIPAPPGFGLALRLAGVAGRTAESAFLAGLDAALAAPVAQEAVDRVLESELVERTIERLFAGPLVDAVAREIVEHQVPQRLADRLLAAGIG